MVHLKWKSLGKLEPGGTREQETDRRRGGPIVEGCRPRPGQGTDRLRLWKEVGCEPIPVEAGSPWRNGYIESSHGRLRDEFLERVEFESVADARAKGGWFRREYNTIRPHSSIGYKTPREYSEE